MLTDSRRAAHSFSWGRMIQPYDLVTALDLQDLMLFFWFTLLFDLPRYILSAIALACVPCTRRRPNATVPARLWPGITGWLYEPRTNQLLSGVVRGRNIYRRGCDLRYFPTITFSCNSAIGTRTRTSLVQSRTACPAFATRRSRQTAFRRNLARDRQGTSAEFRTYNAFWK